MWEKKTWGGVELATTLPSLWFQPIWNILYSQIGSFPQGWKEKIFEAPPSCSWEKNYANMFWVKKTHVCNPQKTRITKGRISHNRPSFHCPEWPPLHTTPWMTQTTKGACFPLLHYLETLIKSTGVTTLPTQTMHYYHGKSLKFTTPLHCLIPPTWVPFNDPLLCLPIGV